MVKPGRLVAGKVLGVGAAIGALAIAAYAFRYTNAGQRIVESFQGAGLIAGKTLLAPIEGLIKGVAAGTGGVAVEGAKVGANLASFSEAIAAGDFQSIIDGTYLEKYGAPGDQSKRLTGTGSEQQPPKATQPTDTITPPPSNTRPTTPDKRPTAPTPTKPNQPGPQQNNPQTTPSNNVRTTTVQTRITSPTTGITTNKQVTTAATNTVKFRQNDGDIVYVSPSTARALEQRGTGRIVTTQSPTAQTGR